MAAGAPGVHGVPVLVRVAVASSLHIVSVIILHPETTAATALGREPSTGPAMSHRAFQPVSACTQILRQHYAYSNPKMTATSSVKGFI